MRRPVSAGNRRDASIIHYYDGTQAKIAPEGPFPETEERAGRKGSKGGWRNCSVWNAGLSSGESPNNRVRGSRE